MIEGIKKVAPLTTDPTWGGEKFAPLGDKTTV